MTVCTCGADTSRWRPPHKVWCPAAEIAPPMTTISGRDWPRVRVPERLRGAVHDVVFSGRRDGNVLARCNTCAELGYPWRTALQGGRYDADRLVKLTYQHSGLRPPRDRLADVRDWCHRRLEPRRGASLHWRLALAELRRELLKILGPSGIN